MFCRLVGAIILDLDATDLPTIASYIVSQLVKTDQITDEQQDKVLQALLLKHR